jgi:hypothetical protein
MVSIFDPVSSPLSTKLTCLAFCDQKLFLLISQGSFYVLKS